MREVFDFILAVGVQDKPVRLMEDWLLFVQMARNQPVWLIEDPPCEALTPFLKEMVGRTGTEVEWSSLA